MIDFLAGGTTPGNLIAFGPCEAARERVGELLRWGKNEALSTEEAWELEHSVQLEHWMRLAKARAPLRLAA